MDRRRAAGALLALAACIACSAAAPTANDHTALDMYDGTSEGCYYNFQHYGEGDRIMTNEPCLNCTCHNKMLMCYLRVCPFTKPIGQDCTVEKRADQCCPIVTCPDVPVDLLTSTSTTSPAEYGATGIGKLDKYGCSIHGKYFSEGSKVPPTPNKPCEHCYCIRNMTTCVMQECTLHVDGCTPIYHKEVCCPVRYSCDHPEDEILLLDDMTTTVRPTPGFLLTTTTLSPVTQMTQDCVHDDRVFPDGALIKTEKACEHCYCMKGDIVCVVQECGTPMENEGKNCSSLPPREGQCCPDTYICEGDELSTEPSTEEMLQEQLTTLSPPRRVGVEGSGYRNEPGEAAQTESSVTDIEIEGSGEEQSNTVQEVDTTGLFGPETSTPALTDEYLATTEKEQQYIPITTKSPKLDENVEGTESPEPSQGINIIPEEVPNEVSTVPDQYVSSTTVVPTQQKEHIPLTTSVSVQDVEISTKKTLDGQDLTSVTISEKESSDLDQFIPITTSTPIEDIGGEDTTEPTETQPSITSESSEQEPIIPTTAKAPTVEESKEPSIEPIEDQDVKPGDTTEVETEEPEEYSSITTSKPKLEESETPSIDPGVSDPEAVTESKLPELDEGEIYTTETSEGHDEASGTINEKDSSEPELISVTTTTPVLHEIEKESTLPNIVSEAITENDGSDFDQFIPITTSLPALDEKDQLSTKLNSEITTDFVETTDRFVPEKYYTTISSLVDEKDESTTIVPINQDITQTATSNKESSEPDEFIKRTTVTSLLEEEHLSTIIPIEDEFTKPQPTTTPAYDKDEETSVGLDKQQDSDSGITSKDQTSGLEEPKSTEPTTDKKQVTGTETTTIVADVSSVSKEEPFTITTEASLRKEDSIAPTDSQKQLETTSVNIESITESINLETKSPISSSPEDHPITKEDEIKETIESTTTAVIKEDKKEPLSESEGEIAITTTAIDKMQLPETTTINIGDNEIDEDSVITSGRIPGEGDCLLNGITYRNESVVPSSNNCHIGCRCISSIIKCEPVICSPPPEYMNNCQPTYDSSESCCPTYVCDHSKETIPPESQSQMSGTESPGPSPTTFECRGDQCEVSEEKVQSCASGDCSKEPSVEPECSSENCSPIQAPTHPESAEHPEKCEAGKCEPSKETCANGECQHPPIVEQALPVKPCESDNCEEKSDESVIPQIPVVSCGGESGLGDCSLDATSPPQNVEKDVTCADENGCQKPQEESKLECVGESCRRKESADIDGKLPSPCTGSECAQQTPTQNSLEMDIPTSKSPEPVVDTLDTTLKPLVTKDQEAQTEVPTSDTTETVTTTSKISEQITTESQDHASSDTEGLITKTTKDSSFNDITTLLPETISESIEIESPDEESHKKVTTGIPQTEDIHLETTGTVPLEDSTKQDVPIISDLETELTTKISVSENQDVYTEKPLPTTETPFSSTEKSHDVSDIVESEKDMIVTQLPEETVDLNESSTVSSDKQEMEPGTDQVVEYTEKPGEKLETSDCSSEDCSNKETQTLPQSVEHTKECVDGKCEPSEANCVNGKCDLLPIEGSKLTESPINQQTSEITEDHIENDKTTISPVVSEIMGSHTDSSELTDSTVIPQTIEEFTEKVHETPETQTTQVVDSTDTQELVTKKPEEQEVSQTESPHSYVTEPFKETKSPDFNDQPSYDITKTPEMPVTELEKETKLPISELDEVSTKLSEIDTIKELTTEQYDNTQQSIDDSSQDVGEAPSKTVPEIIPTLSNEVVTESSDIPYIPDVETDIDSTLKLDQTTKASLLTVTTGIDEVKTTHIILEEENTETPSVYTTKAEELFTNENVQSITEQTQTISQVTGRPSAVTADLEQQEIITEKIKISAEPEEPVTDGIVTYPESHDIEPQKNTPSIVSPQKEIGTLETLVPSDKFTEEKVTTESMIPISTEKEITEPINVTEMNIAVDQTDLPHHGIITQLPEAMMTEEPETTDNPETDISKDEILKTESPEQHDGLEKITTAATTEPLIDNEIKHEYPAQTSQTVKEEHSTEVPIHYATEPQKSHTDSLEPDVTEAEHNELQTETSKPSILDDTTKTGQHVESPDESPQSPVEHDENTEVPAISPEQPVPSQSTEFSTTAPQEESTGDEYVTPKESATVKYQEDLITDKTPQIATEPSEPYIPVHHEYSSTETPQESVTDLPHKVSEQDDVSVTEQYDITTISDELVKESHTETSKVDVTEPQELITETPDVAVKEDIITEKPTEHFEITDEKLDITTAIPKLPTTEIQDTESTEDIYTKTPLSLVTEAPKDTTKKIEDAADHKTTESVETPNAFEGLSTEVPAITSPQEYVTKSHDVVTKSPEITDIEVNEIKTETIPLMEIETSTKSVELPVTETEIFTTEPQSHEGETKTPESMVTESQDLGSTEKPKESTTLAEEIYTEQPSKLPVSGSEATDTDLSSVTVEDELPKLSTESPVPLVTDGQQITTEKSETQEIFTDPQSTSTGTPIKSEPEEQEQHSESYLTVTTASGEAITEKTDLVKEPETVTTISDHLTTEKTDILHPESYDTQVPIEISSKLPLPYEDIITNKPDETEVTSVPKFETSESTPYLIELEEHTHKLEEELSTTGIPDEQLITSKVEVQQEQNESEITTKKSIVEDSTASEADEIPIKKDETIPTVTSLLPSDEVYVKTTESSVSTEEITSLPITSELPATPDVVKTYETEAVVTVPSTSAPIPIEKETTTHTVSMDIEGSPIQDLTPTEQTEEDKTISEKPHKPDVPSVTTPPEEVLISTTIKATTPKFEDATTQTPAPIDKHPITEEKPSEIMPSTTAPELSKPGSNEIQPTDEVPSPDDGGHLAPSGTSGYGPEPDYFEEDQTFGPGTCRYGGKVYVSAQQIPRDDPCDFCFCFRSDIICLQQSCPPPIHGCHEEPIQGFCCPRYECPVSMATTLNVTTTTTTTTTTLPPHFPTHPYKGAAQRKGCQIKGHTYKVGEVVRASSGPCLHCTCGGDGQMKCDPKACTPEPMLRQMIAAAVSAKRRR